MQTTQPTDKNEPFTVHRENPRQGGAEYVRCRECGAELIVEAGGWDKLVHKEHCSHRELPVREVA